MGSIPSAAAQDFPNRSVRIVVPYPPGGNVDITARTVQVALGEALGQQVVVDGRPGASGTTAAGQVARAAPDGYTLIAIPGGHATAEVLYRRLPYRTVDDFSMISMTSEYPFAFVTYSDHTIRTMADLIGTARSRKTPLLYGSPGIGSVHHLSVELLASMANIQLQHIPYRGSAQTVTDLIGKRIDFMIDAPTLILEFVRNGRLRALGVTGASRFFSLPNVPTISETALPGYVITSWQGLAGPVGMPASIVDRLNGEMAEILAEPVVIERLRNLGNDPKFSSPGEFRARVVADIEKWTGVVAAANIERI